MFMQIGSYFVCVLFCIRVTCVTLNKMIKVKSIIVVIFFFNVFVELFDFSTTLVM